MRSKENAEINELILNAQKGDENSLNKLISKYEPLMTSLLSKFSLTQISNEDQEDLKQEMLIVFCKAIMKYDLSQNEVDFGLYAKICLERGIISLIRAAKRRLRVESILIGDGIDIEDEEDPSAKIIQAETMEEMLSLINKSLSEYENKVWSLHLLGLGSQDIAKEMNRDVKSIDNALFRIRAKLRRALEGIAENN